jgi:glycosyltransferase involved in cell wall biosynthesis
MRLLFYLHQFPAIGGIETVTATLANQFVAGGDSVVVLSHVCNKDNSVGAALDAKVRVLRMPEAVCVSPSNTAFLQRMIRDNQIDLVIFQDSYVPIEQNLFVPSLRVPVVTCEHNAPCYNRPFAKRGWSVRECLRRRLWPYWELRRQRAEGARKRFLYKKSAFYVLLSNRFYGEFRAITGLVDTRKMRALPNPISPCLSVASPVEKQNEILFVGTLNHLKGCDMLLSAWRLVESSHLDWCLTIVGDGCERRALEMQAGDLARVNFIGYQSDPSPYFARAKIFAFPSRREGWGMVLVEAMAYGCVPVVFDSYSALHDIVSDGRDGIVVPAFDIRMYAKALDKLISEPLLCQSYGFEARAVMRRFDVSAVDRDWQSLFQQILAENCKRRE